MKEKVQGTVDLRRVQRLNEKLLAKEGPVIYWMSRDQRVADNWALLYAQELALAHRRPLIVLFCLAPQFLGATINQYRFMLRGLAELETELANYNIPFYLLQGYPPTEVSFFCRARQVGAVICDFSPLRLPRAWKQETAKQLEVAFWEVDAHNVIPCWHASPKQEYAAYTFRPKLHRLLPEFLVDLPPLLRHPYGKFSAGKLSDWQAVERGLSNEQSVVQALSLVPGEAAAWQRMVQFIEEKLARYAAERNDPTKDGQSNLSGYLHFGQLSAQRLALAVREAGEETGSSVDTYLEELLVRRELADNFCYYNVQYDKPEGFPNWARQTLTEHRDDPREYLYSLQQFEEAKTHDPLWNAAQQELLFSGKMHGYMRMYWAKKILEWSESPQQAMQFAIYLNDKYSLDGRDPNGYCGIAWSIGGVHDRAWKPRPIFGKIRYMSYNGSKSKFNIQRYLEKVTVLSRKGSTGDEL